MPVPTTLNTPNNQVDLLKSHLLFLEAENQAFALRIQQLSRQLEESRAELRSAHVMHNALLTRVAPVSSAPNLAAMSMQTWNPMQPEGATLYACPANVRMGGQTWSLKAVSTHTTGSQAHSTPLLRSLSSGALGMPNQMLSSSGYDGTDASGQATALLFDDDASGPMDGADLADLLLDDQRAGPSGLGTRCSVV